MAKLYSEELRERVVNWYDECEDYEKITERYGLHPSTVRRWIKRRDTEGHYNPKPNGHRPRTVDLERLKELALDQQDRIQEEMAQQFGVTQPAISYFHKGTRVKALLEQAGLNCRYLPAYSPDLNPIKHTWASLKKKIRSFLADGLSLENAINSAF